MNSPTSSDKPWIQRVVDVVVVLVFFASALFAFVVVGGIVSALVNRNPHNYGAPALGGLVGLVLGPVCAAVMTVRAVRRGRVRQLFWVALGLLAVGGAAIGLVALGANQGWLRW